MSDDIYPEEIERAQLRTAEALERIADVLERLAPLVERSLMPQAWVKYGPPRSPTVAPIQWGTTTAAPPPNVASEAPS